MKKSAQIFSAAIIALTLVFNVALANRNEINDFKTSDIETMCLKNIEQNINKLYDDEEIILDLDVNALIIELDRIEIDTDKINKAIQSFSYDLPENPKTNKMATAKDKEQR